MSLINYSSREINCKIVYYGPGLGGKTTNIQYVYEKLAPETKGKLVTLATEMDRTLFFDFLPLELGEVKGFKTRFHLYTVPGQVYYNASRKLILRGVDGIVFVADSSESRFDANIEALYNLHENLKEYDLEPGRDPLRHAVEQAGHARRAAGGGTGRGARTPRATSTSRPSRSRATASSTPSSAWPSRFCGSCRRPDSTLYMISAKDPRPAGGFCP